VGHPRIGLQDAPAGAWVELAEVSDVGFPDDQVADVEATHYKSPQKPQGVSLRG
jgi:hypothetical protein